MPPNIPPRDTKNAVPFDELDDIDWRRRHNELRRRLERMLGKDIIVVGVGEVEADYDRKVWQPHHHLVIYGTTEQNLEELREGPLSRTCRPQPTNCCAGATALAAHDCRAPGSPALRSANAGRACRRTQ